MDGDDKTARERKQRLRQRREAAGMAQISGWVPAARRSYARQVLKAVAEGANSLPPDPEMTAALEVTQAELAAARMAIEAGEQRGRALQTECDAAMATWASERDKGRVATQAAQTAQELATEALRRAEKAETIIRQTRNLPGVRGRLVRWLTGAMLER
jgi:hypothetical protein